MNIVYINKKHQCRTVTFDEAENRCWVKPNIRERLLEKRMVGFDLNQLKSIKEMPSIAEKVSTAVPMVYLLMMFKDTRQVAVGVDEKGLNAVTTALETAEQKNNEVSDSLIYTAL